MFLTRYVHSTIQVTKTTTTKQLSYLEKKGVYLYWGALNLEQMNGLSGRVQRRQPPPPAVEKKTLAHPRKLLLMSFPAPKRCPFRLFKIFITARVSANFSCQTDLVERDCLIWFLTAVAAGRIQIIYRNGGCSLSNSKAVIRVGLSIAHKFVC